MTHNTSKTENLNPAIPGWRYRQTHKQSVLAILGIETPRTILSKGASFYNRDRWTAKTFLHSVSNWMKSNSEPPPLQEVRNWISNANALMVSDPEIVIAETPDILPVRVAMALTGGAYHEAWHTLFSCKRDLDESILEKLHWGFQDWKFAASTLPLAASICEDIRIERMGRIKFPGTYTKMCDLQDLLITQESQKKMTNTSCTLAVFRDFGLGYNTEKQIIRLEEYAKFNPQGYLQVTQGDLRPLLEEAMSSEEDLDFISLGMRIVELLQPEEAKPELKNNSSALSEIFKEIPSHTHKYEYAYRPWDSSKDEVNYVHSLAKVETPEIEADIATLQSNLRVLFKGLQQTKTLHRATRGKVSERCLVDAALYLKERFYPKKVYQTQTPKIDTSLCVSICVDESASMHSRLNETQNALLLIGEGLYRQRIPMSIVGFRDKPNSVSETTDRFKYHRSKPVVYDVFKSWEENWRTARGNLTNLTATGQTPMADGIEFCLRQIAKRKETHKIVIVITDGMPSPGHEEVVKSQSKWADQEGIFLLAIGIGIGNFGTLFQNSVCVKRTPELGPAILKELLRYLQELRTGSRRLHPSRN